ncbi:unnamed protein product, partial [Mesorhabditis spiculigera]
MDDANEDLCARVKAVSLEKYRGKGLISIHFDMEKGRAVFFTTQAIGPKEICGVFFDCGCEVVSQVVRIDGVEERFAMYASEREQRVEKNVMPLPDYLDEHPTNFDPSSTLVPKEHAERNGWISSVASYVKWW